MAMPKPKFQIGDKVRVWVELNDRSYLVFQARMRGVVTGVRYLAPNAEFLYSVQLPHGVHVNSDGFKAESLSDSAGLVDKLEGALVLDTITP